MRTLIAVAFLVGVSFTLVHAGPPVADDLLPPLAPWNGKSRALALAPDHPWATPCERSGLTATPRYAETVSWLRRLVDAAPELSMSAIGRSAEGRDIVMVLATRATPRTPEGLRASGKPLVLIQAGIHSGEIDGKDAGMMLLRDMTVLGTRRGLLDRANVLFVPILNVDGHERFSRFNRINQRGPVEMGWRTNARNLNLNRDYTKLETEGVRAIVGVITTWSPDLYLDLHVTDGGDYQYDVTWGATPGTGGSPSIAGYIDGLLRPAVDARLVAMGHVPGPFVWFQNGRDASEGLAEWIGSPRFSNVYGAVRHLPTILVENHSLKPYDRRVLGTYVFLDAVLDRVGRDAAALRRAAAKDRALRPDPVVLEWGSGEGARQTKLRYLGIRPGTLESPVTGGAVVRWTGEPYEADVTVVHADVPVTVVDRPEAYVVPAAWTPIVDKLRLHGIAVERLDAPATLEVETYRVPDAAPAGGGASFDERSAIYEGRMRVDPGKIVTERRTVTYPAGSYRVGTDQPLGDLAVLLLEPRSPDSFFQWGYFLEILDRTEYAESYVIEPLARRMLEADPALTREFREKLASDPKFAADPKARLDWFYRRSPYFDATYRLYPIARVPYGDVSRKPLSGTATESTVSD